VSVISDPHVDTISATQELFIASNVSAFSLSDYFTRPSQFLFAMEPGHPAAYFIMREIQDNLLALPNIITPKTVYVTGPHAFFSGYRQFLYGDENLQQVIPDPPILDDPSIREYVGIKGKVWRRNIRMPGRDKMYSNQRYLSHTWYGERVDYQGKNITRKERARLHSDTSHWKDKIKEVSQFAGRDSHRSCVDYLRLLEKNPFLEQETH